MVWKSSQMKRVTWGSEASLMRTITFLRWPSLNLKISSCSWYSACDNLQQDTEPTLVQLKLCAWMENRREEPFSYASLSVPFVLLLRLFCSRLGGGVCAMDGGLRLARSFRCLSMSSRWELILSCCLETEEGHALNLYYQSPEHPNTRLAFPTSSVKNSVKLPTGTHDTDDQICITFATFPRKVI